MLLCVLANDGKREWLSSLPSILVVAGQQPQTWRIEITPQWRAMANLIAFATLIQIVPSSVKLQLESRIRECWYKNVAEQSGRESHLEPRQLCHRPAYRLRPADGLWQRTRRRTGGNVRNQATLARPLQMPQLCLQIRRRLSIGPVLGSTLQYAGDLQVCSVTGMVSGHRHKTLMRARIAGLKTSRENDLEYEHALHRASGAEYTSGQCDCGPSAHSTPVCQPKSPSCL